MKYKVWIEVEEYLVGELGEDGKTSSSFLTAAFDQEDDAIEFAVALREAGLEAAKEDRDS